MDSNDRPRGRSGAAFREWHRRTRPGLPRCGAKARTTGEPCKQIAMKNGRCAYHGGHTPKGDSWHKPRWPDGKRPDAAERLNRKLADLETAEKKRRKRRARMDPDELARHAAWQRTQKPGKAAERRRLRANAQAAKAARETLLGEPDVGAANPAIAALQRVIDALESRLAGNQPAVDDMNGAPAPEIDIFS